MKKYVKGGTGDFSNIQWKCLPCTIHGLTQPSMYYTKDLGNGYYATITPEYRKNIDVVVWLARIYEVNRLCDYESFETSYDAQDWVDYEAYERCIKSIRASEDIAPEKKPLTFKRRGPKFHDSSDGNYVICKTPTNKPNRSVYIVLDKRTHDYMKDSDGKVMWWYQLGDAKTYIEYLYNKGE